MFEEKIAEIIKLSTGGAQVSLTSPDPSGTVTISVIKDGEIIRSFSFAGEEIEKANRFFDDKLRNK